MKIYAVIDTNVILSALLSKKSDVATVKVLRAIESGKICPLLQDLIIDEYNEVLTRSKFHLPTELIEDVIRKIVEVGQNAERIHSTECFPDPKDIVFYEVALSKEDAYLVTGNKKHFPQKPIVVTPSEMLEILEQ
ncbi:MAG: putative toxin-antitoxin system toxin component, PIN family [Bacteroidales bacterium]|nr:putative toxin-antitoxin system toxin component, PIN family [Bacteroidales bacterium]